MLEEKRHTDPKANRVEFWERWELLGRHCARSFPFDLDAAVPYLDRARVEQRALGEVGKLLGLQFKAIPGAPTWDPSVTVYEVKDTTGTRVLRQIYLDLADSPHKRPRPFTQELGGSPPRLVIQGAIVRREVDGKQIVNPERVSALFHELGHAAKILLRTEPSAEGKDMPDEPLEEGPSLFLELWASQPEVMRAVFQNADGQPIPDDLLQPWLRSIAFGKASRLEDQALDASFNLEACDRDPQRTDFEKMYRDLQRGSSKLLERSKDDSARFLLMPDLGLGPESIKYMAAQAAAYQLVQKLSQDGLRDPKVGAQFRKWVLSGQTMTRAGVEKFTGKSLSTKALKTALEHDQAYV